MANSPLATRLSCGSNCALGLLGTWQHDSETEICPKWASRAALNMRSKLASSERATALVAHGRTDSKASSREAKCLSPSPRGCISSSSFGTGLRRRERIMGIKPRYFRSGCLRCTRGTSRDHDGGRFRTREAEEGRCFRKEKLVPFKRAIVRLPRASSDGATEWSAEGKEEIARNPEVDETRGGKDGESTGARLGSQSSWEATNAEGEDYLYRLGKEADNLNVTVGARAGVIDDLFVGGFLGKDADIVFKYRQQVTRQFGHLHGDYYIAPAFMDKVVLHIAKNFLGEQISAKVPLILGIWGGKGQGKTFQTELIFKAMGVEPVIMSAGELESEWAGEPGRLIRDRYRAAAMVIKNKGVMSCLVINDLDAGVGRFENTQVTVNNQMVMGTLMNLCDNPNSVSTGQSWRDDDFVPRVPIIVTGNDFSTLYAPLVRDGRMEKFYWAPTRDDLIGIVYQMYHKDGVSEEDIAEIIDRFPGQALDFYGAIRSRTYDDQIRKWVEEIGGPKKVVENLKKKGKARPSVTVPEISVDILIQAGNELVEEQRKVTEMRLSEEYMKTQTGPGSALSFS